MNARVALASLVALAACGPSRPPRAIGGIAYDDGRPVRSSTMAVGEAPDEAFRATPPPPAKVRPLAAVVPEETRLSNGIRVVLLPRHNFPEVAVVAAIDRGASAASEAAAAVYAYSMLGSSEQYTARENWGYLGYIGAHADALVWQDAVALRTTAVTAFWVSAMAHTGPMFATPMLGDDDIEHARRAVGAARGEEGDRGSLLARDQLLAELYADQRGRPVHGRSNVEVERVGRGAVESFREMFWSAGHIVVAAVGHFDRAQMLRILEKHFHAIPTKPSRPESPLETPPTRTRVAVVDRGGAVQSNIAFGWAPPDVDSKDALALDVLASVMAQGLSSRLNLEVRRELGASYGVHFRVAPRRPGGYVSIECAVENARTAEIVTRIAAEIEKVRHEELTAEELATAKIATAYELDDASVAGLAAALAHAVAEGLPATWVTERNARIDALTAEDVRAAAERSLPASGQHIVVVGDASRIVEPLRAAKLGTVELVK